MRVATAGRENPETKEFCGVYACCPIRIRRDDRMRSHDERWRATLRLPPALSDPTFVNDTIRREHSPPRSPAPDNAGHCPT
jgi:hypothetical protein